MSMKTVIIGIAAATLLMGCTSTSRICMTPAAVDSVICPTLAKVSMTPEQVNLMFKLANVELIRSNAYQKADVLAFFDGTEKLLNEGTYTSVANYVLFEVAKINKKYQLELVLITQSFEVFQTLNIPINSFDKKMIFEHIAQQRQILALV